MSNKIEGVSATALMVACCNQASDIKYCAPIAHLSHAEEETRSMFGDDYVQAIGQRSQKLVTLRFNSMTAAIRETGIKNLLEIACGLDPRGLILTEDPAFTVVEADLPAMIKLKRGIAVELVGERRNHKFVAADATSRDQMCAAAGLLPYRSPIVIACAGLISYCPMSQKHYIANAITTVLEKRPQSVWLATSEDFFTRPEFEARYNADATSRMMIDKLQEVSGQNFFENAFADEQAIDVFFTTHGLQYTRRKQLDLVPGFADNLEPDIVKRLSKSEIWTMQLV